MLSLSGFYSGSVFAVDGTYISLNSRKNIQQPFLLYDVKAPIATVILFAGGDGYTQLQKQGSIHRLRNNFLLRSISLFIEQSMRVVVFEVPSNRANTKGLFDGYRGTKRHAQDVEVVVDYLRQRYQEPVWLIGTSRGTNSVANAGIHLAGKVDGLIMTAPMAEENKKGTYVTAMRLKKITAPVLLASHKKDKCWVTPPSALKSIKRRLKKAKIVEAKVFDSDVSAAKGRQCGGLSAHGFWGVEAKVIKAMSLFIQEHKPTVTP